MQSLGQAQMSFQFALASALQDISVAGNDAVKLPLIHNAPLLILEIICKEEIQFVIILGQNIACAQVSHQQY